MGARVVCDRRGARDRGEEPLPTPGTGCRRTRLYLRAATYYSTALYLITHSSDPGRQHDIWLRQRACWDSSVDLAAVPGERLEIPYEGTTLPGYFFRAPDAAPGEARPLVVMQQRQRRRDVGHGAVRRASPRTSAAITG